MQMNSFRNSSRILSGLIVGLLGMGLSVSAVAQSQYFPTYVPGPLGNGTWVVANGQIITPAGIQVNLVATESSGTGIRAKAIALNPIPLANGHRTASVLTMGGNAVSGAVEVFDVTTGAILQEFSPNNSSKGSSTGIAYTQDGNYLLLSQDNSYVSVASVGPDGLLTYKTQINLPVNLSFITCFPNSPPGTTGSSPIPCGQTVSSNTAYPLGLAISADGKTAYSVLDNNDSLTKIDLTTTPPTQVAEIRVGNVPNSVVISSDGRTAYVSNEAGRVATQNDFQEYSNGTPVVANNPAGSIATATISVVDLGSFSVTNTITLTGLHPIGMAFWGQYLLAADTYSDVISVVDTTSNTEVRKINLGLPIGVIGTSSVGPSFGKPGASAYGAAPNSIAVDAANNVAYVALYNANAIAVVDLSAGAPKPIKGMIPVGYAPSSVVLDAADNMLLVASDKGIGTTNTDLANNCATYYSVCGFNSHQDQGTVNIVPVPGSAPLAQMSLQVFQNNHWDLQANIAGGLRRQPEYPSGCHPCEDRRSLAD